MSAAPAARPPRLHRPDSAPSLPARRRATWHQRLIDAEGGWRLGLRANSTLHVHLFSACAVGISGVVLGLTFADWLLLIAAFAATVSAELFHLAVQLLVEASAGPSALPARRALRLSTAAALTVCIAATSVALAILARRLWQLFT